MRVSSEFSKHAQHYGSYNVIQNKVIDRLLKKVKHKPKNILDLGCGSGALHNSIKWKYKHFTGVDFAPGMLELHPKAKNCECIYGDFNDTTLFENLLTYRYDYIFSASALQWADNLDMVFKNIKSLNAPISLAIFSANTFKTLNETAGLTPLLRSAQMIDELQKKYFDAELEIVEYKLEFESTRNMFKYIKNSGVSGSRKVLDYKQTKKLMQDYPLNYLEFEVVFIHSR
ncbi:methyltransferase, type 12 [Sulfurimonas gotlandica GD1]|uniref:Methyltransferase, type 12 n=1 Tax=Sulfurimonas gotlandica (strain DSM 19862 / JCM 16533 / GD1) TaxID=929558 RepID=B6BGV3_SULGG|nr:methyltransferase domain-containing protein [Sulfurimonas gotlandica]EDZ62903.1 putative methyl transferase [Sulfurimonas gotlandica GD1]EHP29737.1 methyltransferase, type 12 [Sulfurimonas gotlandica GD1]